MTWLARIAIALGLVTCLLPWALKALDLTSHRMHTDLWISFGAFAAAAFVEWGAHPGERRAHRILAGAVAVLVAAVNAPELWSTARALGDPGVDGYVAEGAIRALLAYAAAALAGVVLAMAGLLAKVAPR